MANVTISKLSDGTNTGYIASQAYFECSTAASTAAKVATSPDSIAFSGTSLVRGVTVQVKFTDINSASSPTLKVGTSTAKSITGSTNWLAGSVVSFTYDGTSWIQNDDTSSSGGYLMFSSDSSFTLAVGDATKHWDGTLEYSTDGFNWTIWDGTSALSSVNNTLYLRGIGNTYITGPGTTTSDSRYFVFTNATNLICKGNIENLLDYQSVTQGIHPTMGERCFMRLFYGCTSLVEPPELPATTLSDRCYNNMFNGCTALTRTPLLPAVDLAVFCYTGLFKSCTSLVAASFSELPARNVPSTAYAQMFWGCTSLIKAPDILADTLDHQSCYGMFEYCSALKKAPKILANTMAEASCAGMFQHCSALEEASALPATILAKDCYQGMYNDCDSLKSIPALPAVTLSENCYGNMFQHSAAIKLSTTQTGEYQIQYRIPSEGTGVTATDALNVMFTDTGGTFSSTPTINTTYWLSTSNSIVYPEGKGYVSVDGDTVRGDITLAAPANNNSPALIFQRGVLNDNYNDWRIQDRGGFLRFDQRGNGSTTWSEIASINTTGTITSVAFSGSGASLTSLNASNISSGTLADGRLPSTVEKVANKVTSITSSSTDTEYPSAKAVYDAIQGDNPVEDADVFLSRISSFGENKYKSAKLVGGTVAFNQLGNATIPAGTYTFNTALSAFTSYADHIYLATTDRKELSLRFRNITTGLVSNSGITIITKISSTYAGAMTTVQPNGTSTSASKINIFDLTLMLGKTIADRIYALETATAGSGVAWFKKYFPKDYYPYDTGTLVSACPTGMASGDASYSVSPLELNGYPSLDSNDNLVYNGDIRESNGKVTRKYAKINLKAFSGKFGATDNGYAVYYMNYALKRSSQSICPSFTYSNESYPNMPVMTWCGRSGATATFTFILPSTVTSLAEANAWLASNPISFIAKTSSEHTESTYPFKSPQLVYSGETESFIDDRDVPMPVGQIAEYMDNFDAVEDAALADSGNFELLSRKTTTVDSSSTDDQYPSAKAVYDLVSSSSNDVPVMLVTANYTYDGGGHYTFTGYSVTAPTVSELYNYTQTSGNRTINFNFADKGEYGQNDSIEACVGAIGLFNNDTSPTAVTIFAYLLGFGASEVDFQIYLTDDASTTTVTKTVYSSVTSISSSSTDTQYPTAKAVYDLISSSSSDVPTMLVTANYTYEGGGEYSLTGYSVTGPTVSELYNYAQTSGNRMINFNYCDTVEYGQNYSIAACTSYISYFNYDTPPTAAMIVAHMPGGAVYASDFYVNLTDDASTTTVTKTVCSSVTSISSSSTDNQYPTAKAVYDLVNSTGSVLNVISGTTTWGQVIDAYTANKSIIYKTQGTDPQLGRIYQLSLYNVTIMGSTVSGTLAFTSLGSVSYNSSTVPGYVELKWTLSSGTRSSVISYSDATQTVVPLVNLDNVAY